MNKNVENYKKAMDKIEANENLKDKTFHVVQNNDNSKKLKINLKQLLAACAVFVLVVSAVSVTSVVSEVSAVSETSVRTELSVISEVSEGAALQPPRTKPVINNAAIILLFFAESIFIPIPINPMFSNKRIIYQGNG